MGPSARGGDTYCSPPSSSSSVVPTEFDGIDAQLADGVATGQVSGDNVRGFVVTEWGRTA